MMRPRLEDWEHVIAHRVCVLLSAALGGYAAAVVADRAFRRAFGERT